MLAADYGFASWAELMRRVDEARGGKPGRVAAAARRGGASGRPRGGPAPARRRPAGRRKAARRAARRSGRPAPATRRPTARMAIAEALLAAGANPRHDNGGETALHAAAGARPAGAGRVADPRRRPGMAGRRQGPAAARRRPARQGGRQGRDHRAARPAGDPRSRRSAPPSRHCSGGDVAGLARLLDAEPRLLRERILEPECYREASRSQYFRDPKLFWFIANNPTLMQTHAGQHRRDRRDDDRPRRRPGRPRLCAGAGDDQLAGPRAGRCRSRCSSG